MSGEEYVISLLVLAAIFALSGPVWKDIKERVSFYFFPPGPME
jgi:hypothetical protein